MTTAWTRPSTIRQYAEAETNIAWHEEYFRELLNDGPGALVTTKPLLHIARSPKTDLTYNTCYLELTGFNFTNVPEAVSGISAVIVMNRGGRIADETIQLTYQGELIGSNRPAGIMDPITSASLLAPVTHYGGVNDTWDIKNLTLGMITDPSFGITVRYQSHPRWPHSTSPTLRSIQLQIS
jgi:hypothetical protein